MLPAPACRPLPWCPAILGRGTDLAMARFTLAAQDCERGPDGQMTLTEVTGLYQVPGQAAGDVIHAGRFTVPAGSPPARQARQVARSRRRTRLAGELRRAAITACSCAPPAGCAALDDVALLEAIEHAARRPVTLFLAFPGTSRAVPRARKERS